MFGQYTWFYTSWPRTILRAAWKLSAKNLPGPNDGFPLFPHGRGQWCKTILGEHHYLGKWDNWQAALDKFNREKDHLYAGQRPPSDVTSLADVLNAFRKRKKQAVDDGELTERSFGEYESVCDTIATLGKQRPVEVVDLAELRTKICKGKNGKRRSPTSQKRLLGIARMVFNFANEEMEPPLAKPVRYRKALKLPPAKTIRQSRNEASALWRLMPIVSPTSTQSHMP